MSGDEQKFLLAAVDRIKAAPPNPICYSPAGPGMGRPNVLRITAPLDPRPLRGHTLRLIH